MRFDVAHIITVSHEVDVRECQDGWHDARNRGEY